VETIKRVVAATLSALAASSDGSAPEGVLYAAMMGVCDLQAFNVAMGFLCSAKLATCTGHVVRITEAGRAIAAQIDEAMAAAATKVQR
jgi:hypothetical protein